jgi:TetR/AcrR family transcriptional regulator, transcriptional repressor for nem operon
MFILLQTMPRSAKLDRAEIAIKAMYFFWEHGFDGASIDALIRAVGTTRFTLYQLFDGKEGLYAAALDQYRDTIVTQALVVMTIPAAGIDGIANYFEFLIQQAQQQNCLSRGCLMTNTMVILPDHDGAIATKVDAHFERITAGMRQTLSSASSANAAAIDAQALYLATFAQGLWIRARAGADAVTLRAADRAAIAPLELT